VDSRPGPMALDPSPAGTDAASARPESPIL